MKRAIHFGAGEIGRGFIGALLSQAGYEVRFAEGNPQLVDEIDRRRGYTVHVTDEICAELRIAAAGVWSTCARSSPNRTSANPIIRPIS